MFLDQEPPAEPKRFPPLIPGSTLLTGLDSQRGIREEPHGAVADGEILPTDQSAPVELRHGEMGLHDLRLERPI